MFDFDDKLKEQMNIAKTTPDIERRKEDYGKILARTDFNNSSRLKNAYILFRKFITEAYPAFISSLIERDRNDLYQKGSEYTVLSGDFFFNPDLSYKSDYTFNGTNTIRSSSLCYVSCFVEFEEMIERFLKRNNIGELKKNSDSDIIKFSGTFPQLKNAYLMELQLLEKTQADLAAANEYKSDAFDFDKMFSSQKEMAKKLLSDKIKLNNAVQKGSASLELYNFFIENIYPSLIKNRIETATCGQVSRLPVNEEGFSIIEEEDINNFFLYIKLFFRHSNSDIPYIYYDGTDKIIIDADKEIFDDLLHNFFSEFCKSHNLGYYYETNGYPFVMTLCGHGRDLKNWYYEEREKTIKRRANIAQEMNPFPKR